MKWNRNLGLSVKALTRSWLRTLLSLSGVAVGIASVVVLIGAVAGLLFLLRGDPEPRPADGDGVPADKLRKKQKKIKNLIN